jgi:hypothetical protein
MFASVLKSLLKPRARSKPKLKAAVDQLPLFQELEDRKLFSISLNGTQTPYTGGTSTASDYAVIQPLHSGTFDSATVQVSSNSGSSWSTYTSITSGSWDGSGNLDLTVQTVPGANFMYRWSLSGGGWSTPFNVTGNSSLTPPSSITLSGDTGVPENLSALFEPDPWQPSGSAVTYTLHFVNHGIHVSAMDTTDIGANVLYPGDWVVEAIKNGHNFVTNAALGPSSASSDSNSVFVPMVVPDSLSVTDGSALSSDKPEATVSCHINTQYAGTKVDFYDNTGCLGEATPDGSGYAHLNVTDRTGGATYVYYAIGKAPDAASDYVYSDNSDTVNDTQNHTYSAGWTGSPIVTLTATGTVQLVTSGPTVSAKYDGVSTTVDIDNSANSAVVWTTDGTLAGRVYTVSHASSTPSSFFAQSASSAGDNNVIFAVYIDNGPLGSPVEEIDLTLTLRSQ